MFSDLTKTLMLAFLADTDKGRSFKVFDSNLVHGPAIHIRFDDLHLISRSQVCLNHKLQIVFRFLYTVV